VKRLGGHLAHIGLALFFLGIVSTGRHSASADLSLIRGKPREALGRAFTYTGYRQLPDGKYAFDVEVAGKGERIRLSPVMFEGGPQGIMRNPDIDAGFLRDIYLSPVSLQQSDAHSSHEAHTIRKGDTVSIGDVRAAFLRFEMGSHGSAPGGTEGMSVGAVIRLWKGDSVEILTPVTQYGPDGRPQSPAVESGLLGAEVHLASVNAGMGGGVSTVTLHVQWPDHQEEGETLIAEASVKPFVSLLWAGTGLMFAGFVLSILRRAREET
ncbi:MAG: hypothetical protein WB626_02755, partial [Bacteroidota bacterium]